MSRTTAADGERSRVQVIHAYVGRFTVSGSQTEGQDKVVRICWRPNAALSDVEFEDVVRVADGVR